MASSAPTHIPRHPQTAEDARAWLIKASLSLSTLNSCFFMLAPVLGYPIEWSQSIRLFEIAAPVFTGYLGSAAHFLFRDHNRGAERGTSLTHAAWLLLRWSVLIFAFVNVIAFVAFGISNRAAAATGSGMDVDTLALWLTIALGGLTLTTNVASAYLFRTTEDSHA